MSIKSIMVAYSGYEEEICALDVAFQLAKRFHAHIDVWHISEHPVDIITKYSGSGYVGPFYDEMVIDALEKPVEQAKIAAEKKFKELALNHEIEIGSSRIQGKASASFLTASGDASIILQTKGRLADLIVLTRMWDRRIGKASEILQHCLFNTGRPVLAVPPGDHAITLNNKIAIAWDGSPQVTQTIALAMPLIRESSVSVITAMSKNAKEFPIDPEEIANALAVHDVDVKTIWAEVMDGDLEETLLESAKSSNASILIMGTYTKNRLSEVIFGGTTEYMLNCATCPILISH
ncbi:MAG: hypothetical protein DI626_08655 [Micavibrio aeruginosavorus]|uniref:UspA domain-containing protein n=1 Tax=Micavibrio aeruginosavorus TaxID=349221 RepID=A0A2W5BLP5_9BACT|nr:MAG: hypothetical protein DI626_08655 [Micavibrio aeruginosavorus]PZP56355.1 MAG: hypothetical protein DI586_03885 [Micavibrio aeruginosavorus]